MDPCWSHWFCRTNIGVRLNENIRTTIQLVWPHWISSSWINIFKLQLIRLMNFGESLKKQINTLNCTHNSNFEQRWRHCAHDIEIKVTVLPKLQMAQINWSIWIKRNNDTKALQLNAFVLLYRERIFAKSKKQPNVLCVGTLRYFQLF